MIYAGNSVPLTTTGQKWQLNEGDQGLKLTVQVFTQRVFLQVAEDYPPTFQDSSDQEMLLEKGFHSREFITPITGFKMRSETGQAVVHFVAYG
jgi:hypothetical protein